MGSDNPSGFRAIPRTPQLALGAVLRESAKTFLRNSVAFERARILAPVGLKSYLAITNLILGDESLLLSIIC
jgi:hypothetical protein